MLCLAVFTALLAFAQVNAWIPGCGQSKYSDAGGLGVQRIVGGQEARPNEFPWQGQMTTVGGSFYCGAIVISSTVVMTAAHCTDGDTAADIRLVLGDHSRTADDGTEQRFSVSVLRQNPSYNPNTINNDISLMTVSGTISLNANVAAVCEPDNEQFVGVQAAVSGWGTTSSGGSCCPTVLRYVQVPIISNAECTGYYGSGDITAGMICAGIPTQTDSCQGDSGGPMVIKRNGAFQVVGIVSWGIGCASGWPGVYTRVTNYLSFIGNP